MTAVPRLFLLRRAEAVYGYGVLFPDGVVALQRPGRNVVVVGGGVEALTTAFAHHAPIDVEWLLGAGSIEDNSFMSCGQCGGGIELRREQDGMIVCAACLGGGDTPKE